MKPRNPMAVWVHKRKAGKHHKTHKQLRRQLNKLAYNSTVE